MPKKELDKNELFDEFVNKPVNKDTIGDFSYLFYQVKRIHFGTELMNSERLLIENKLIPIFNELSTMDDNDYKIDLYSSLINSIKKLHLLERNFPNILSSLEMIDDSYVKRNAYYSLIDAIQNTKLMEEYFTNILNSLETIKVE